MGGEGVRACIGGGGGDEGAGHTSKGPAGSVDGPPASPHAPILEISNVRRRGGRDWRGQGANSYFCYVISVARAVGSSQSLGRRQSGDRLAGSLSCSYSPSLRRQCKCEGAHTHSVCVSVAVVAATGRSSRSRIQVRRCLRAEGLPGARLWKPLVFPKPASLGPSLWCLVPL